MRQVELEPLPPKQRLIGLILTVPLLVTRKLKLVKP